LKRDFVENAQRWLKHPGEVNWVHAITVDSKGDLCAGGIKAKRAQQFVRKEP
jgi:hypothetical protein